MIRSALEWRDVALVPERDVLQRRPGRCRAGRARARRRVRSSTGLRLCGIALEPSGLLRNGSSTSRTSVRCRWRISVAKRFSAGAGQGDRVADSSAWRSRGTTWVETGSGARPSRCRAARLEVRAERGERADGAGDRPRRSVEGALQPVGVAVGLDRVAASLSPKLRRLGMDAVRAADAQRVACSRAFLRQFERERARGGDEDGAGALELQREPGSRRRPRTSARSGSSGRPDPAEAARTSTNAAVSWSRTFSRSSIGSTVKVVARIVSSSLASARRATRCGDLDVAHRAEAGFVGPDGAHLGRVSGDHSALDPRWAGCPVRRL